MGIEEEVAEFIRNERPLWPQTATSCPVQQCRDGHKFSSFNDFIIHWKEMHHETDTRYKCKLCKRSYGTLKHKKSHEKSKCHTGQTVEFETIKIQNPRYIDPKDELPYKLGSTNYRKEMRQIQRQLHGVQRRIEANKWQKSISELPEEEKHYRLCRDERVVERDGVLYKNSNMWDEPSRRKRVKFE